VTNSANGAAGTIAKYGASDNFFLCSPAKTSRLRDESDECCEIRTKMREGQPPETGTGG
jgi:hypothetical protein